MGGPRSALEWVGGPVRKPLIGWQPLSNDGDGFLLRSGMDRDER